MTASSDASATQRWPRPAATAQAAGEGAPTSPPRQPARVATRLVLPRPPWVVILLLLALLPLGGCSVDGILGPTSESRPSPLASDGDSRFGSLGNTDPANPDSGARILFPLSQPGSITVWIYDTQGGLARTITWSYESGSHQIVWDGRTESGLPAGAGIYTYVLELPDGTRFVGRLTLVR